MLEHRAFIVGKHRNVLVWQSVGPGIRVIVDVAANTIKVMGFMIPCPVQLFALNELGAAKEWISE